MINRKYFGCFIKTQWSLIIIKSLCKCRTMVSVFFYITWILFGIQIHFFFFFILMLDVNWGFSFFVCDEKSLDFTRNSAWLHPGHKYFLKTNTVQLETVLGWKDFVSDFFCFLNSDLFIAILLLVPLFIAAASLVVLLICMYTFFSLMVSVLSVEFRVCEIHYQNWL